MEALERLLTLVQRELGADDVRVLDAGIDPPAASNVVHAQMADGRTVVVTYGHMPADGDARLRRLEMLVRTFAQSLAEEAEPGSRRGSNAASAAGAAPSTLGEELRALAMRAQALDALVIDADSPVVWGSALTPDREGRGEVDAAIDRFDRSRRQLVDEIREDDGDDANDDGQGLGPSDNSPPPPPSRTPEFSGSGAILSSVSLAGSGAGSGSGIAGAGAGAGPGTTLGTIPRGASELAVVAARALPGIPSLHKGRHLHHAARGGPWFVVQSFAGIYLLVVVFEGEYDELRTERAIVDGLPRIERMVLALPPLDPEPAPTAEVIRLRSRRR